VNQVTRLHKPVWEQNQKKHTVLYEKAMRYIAPADLAERL
jgi:hypothetical protein